VFPYGIFVFPFGNVLVYNLLYRMHRQPDHVMAFLLAELGTSGSLDGQQRLVVKGRFAPKNFEGILRRYVSKYLLYVIICFGFRNRRLEKYGSSMLS